MSLLISFSFRIFAFSLPSSIGIMMSMMIRSGLFLEKMNLLASMPLVAVSTW